MSKIILMLLLIASSTFGYAEPLLAVAATPTPLTDQRFAAKVLRLDQTTGKVSDVQQLAAIDEGVLFIKSWTDAGFLVAGIPSSGPLTLRILNLRKPPQTVEVQLDRLCKGCTYVDSNFARSPKGQALLRLRFNHSNGITLAAIDLETGAQVDAPSGIGSIYSDGIPGPALPGDFFYVSLQELAAGLAWSGIPPPALALEKDVRTLVTYVRTDRMIVMTTKQARVKEGRGSTRYAVHYRSAPAWREVTFPGGRTDIRVAGDWLVGAVSQELTGDTAASPTPDAALRQTGPSFDSRRILFHLHPAGLLVLYNARSQQLIELRTSHPDSEPLAVIDERLYYRVDDALFAARLTAQGILEPQLIARNPSVRDVHWLFVYSEARK